MDEERLRDIEACLTEAADEGGVRVTSLGSPGYWMDCGSGKDDVLALIAEVRRLRPIRDVAKRVHESFNADVRYSPMRLVVHDGLTAARFVLDLRRALTAADIAESRITPPSA